MRSLHILGAVAPSVLVAISLVVSAAHVPDCAITSADPSTYNTLAMPVEDPFDGDHDPDIHYIEERDVPLPEALPPIPLSGFLTANGTWIYKEDNGLPGLQRGTECGFAGCDWFPPGCDQDWGPLLDGNWMDPMSVKVHPENAPEGVPCLLITEDPIMDENCQHGTDRFIF